MSEIQTPPIKLREGSAIVPETARTNGDVIQADADTVAFTEQHTISDIIRYAASCCDIQEVILLAEIERDR